MGILHLDIWTARNESHCANKVRTTMTAMKKALLFMAIAAICQLSEGLTNCQRQLKEGWVKECAADGSFPLVSCPNWAGGCMCVDPGHGDNMLPDPNGFSFYWKADHKPTGDQLKKAQDFCNCSKDQKKFRTECVNESNFNPEFKEAGESTSCMASRTGYYEWCLQRTTTK